MKYVIQHASAAPALTAAWQEPAWERAQTLQVSHFLAQSSSHHPATAARLLYDEKGIHGIFQVQDRFVRCVRTRYFDDVWKDSCVEFFVQPKAEKGYFNLECNCGGAFLCSYIVNPERTPEGFKEFTKLPASLGQTIQVRSSLPPRVDPETAEALTWTLQFFIPFKLFEHYVGPLNVSPGQLWRGNLQKCADESSHPHWASWSPLDQCNFHRPSCFGTLEIGAE